MLQRMSRTAKLLRANILVGVLRTHRSSWTDRRWQCTAARTPTEQSTNPTAVPQLVRCSAPAIVADQSADLQFVVLQRLPPGTAVTCRSRGGSQPCSCLTAPVHGVVAWSVFRPQTCRHCI